MENRLCNNCGKREHCKWILRGTYYCDLWQTEEKEMKLEIKNKEEFKFKNIWR